VSGKAAEIRFGVIKSYDKKTITFRGKAYDTYLYDVVHSYGAKTIAYRNARALDFGGPPATPTSLKPLQPGTLVALLWQPRGPALILGPTHSSPPAGMFTP
jgi:hypothetical protein